MIVRTTSLTRGERIPISLTAVQRALANFSGQKREQALILGHMAEYTHTELLIKHGFPVVESAPFAPYDRELVGFPVPKQDDKVATFETGDGTLCGTHNITFAEYESWSIILRNGGDVAIQSFEYVDDSYQEIIYRGTISFRALYNAPEKAGIQLSKDKGSYFFGRQGAYKHNLLHG